MRLIIDEMEMDNGEYRVYSDGLFVKAENIKSGLIKFGGFNRDIESIPNYKKEHILEYTTACKYYSDVTDADVVLENSEITWFENINFKTIKKKTSIEMFNITINDTLNSATSKIENKMGRILFYCSYSKYDVIQAVMDEWSIARLIDLQFKYIEPIGLYIAYQK